MTQNPFEALGGGGFDMNALLQQAQQMQEQLARTRRQRLAETVVDGTVAGGAVTVKVNGVGELVGVEIKAGGFDGSDPDDLADLGDMIVAAYRDAQGPGRRARRRGARPARRAAAGRRRPARPARLLAGRRCTKASSRT